MEVGNDLANCLVPEVPGGSKAVVNWRFDVRKRRPMHSGRFIAFLRQNFGGLDDDHIVEASAMASKGSGGLCARRQRNEKEQPSGAFIELESNIGAEEEARLGTKVLSADGCVWFAMSDDCRAEWRFGATNSSSSSTATPQGGDTEDSAPLVPRPRKGRCRHSLRRGAPWYTGDPCSETEAGERKVDLNFELQQMSSEAAVSIEASIRAALDGCLLSRDEAMVLDNFAAVEGLDEWEQRVSRLLQRNADVAAEGQGIGDMSRTLRTLDIAVKVVSALPGYNRAVTIGEAMTRRVSKALGASPGHPGHTDEPAKANSMPAHCMPATPMPAE